MQKIRLICLLSKVALAVGGCHNAGNGGSPCLPAPPALNRHLGEADQGLNLCSVVPGPPQEDPRLREATRSPLDTAGSSREDADQREDGVPDGGAEGWQVYPGHRAHPAGWGQSCQGALAGGLQPEVPNGSLDIPPAGETLHAGEPPQRPWRTRLHGDAVPGQSPDHSHNHHKTCATSFFCLSSITTIL
jgi:hypothetical protein